MARGGARPGAGAPKGHRPKTLEKLEALKLFKDRVVRLADRLANAQVSLATGLTFLYVIRTVDGKRQKPELVEDQETIEAYLEGELEGLEDEYYYITTKEPNNQALDSLLNRTFGKPTESIELSGKDGKDLPTPILNVLVKPNVPADDRH